MPNISETAFNVELGNVLRRKHPRWTDCIGIERTNVFVEAAGLRPDIIVRHPGGLPVSVETEYAPASTVEGDARERLGKTLQQTGASIEQAIAVRIPNYLARVNQGNLGTEIERSHLEFCILSGDADTSVRWPVTGWMDGTVDDLASSIELAAFSEKRLAHGMSILENSIDQAAVNLREACGDAPDTLENIAAELHQKDGIQTSRMAMAILTNALTFHIAIAGAHSIGTPDELRDPFGNISKRKILKVWRHVLTNINYWPIFRVFPNLSG